VPAAPPSFARVERWLVAGAIAYVVVAIALAVWFGGNEGLARLALIGAADAVAVIALASLHILLRIARWHWLCRRAGAAVSPGASALCFLAGLPLTLTPGRSGEAIRAWILKRDAALPYRRGLAVVLVDRAIDAYAIVLLGAIALALATGATSAPALAALVLAALVLAAPAGVTLAPRLLRAATRRLAARGRRRSERPRPRAAALLALGLRGVAVLARPGTLGPATLLALAGWALEATALVVLLDALGAALDPTRVTAAFAAAQLAGVATLLPGGLGGSEVTLAALLAAAGAPVATAVVATALIRLATLGYAVALGLVPLALALGGTSDASAPRPGANPRAAASARAAGGR